MRPGEIIVRDAREHDVAAVAALINEAYIVERFFVTGPRISADALAALMQKGVVLVGVESDGTVVASVYVEPRGERGYVGLLAVSPSRQGSGLGRRMMEAAEQRLAREGCAAVDIRVVSLRTELPPFYERLGYEHRGTEPFHDPRKTQPCHFLKMSKTLNGPGR
jgi:predicted N-acetyltransferase YhbS